MSGFGGGVAVPSKVLYAGNARARSGDTEPVRYWIELCSVQIILFLIYAALLSVCTMFTC